MLFVVLIKYFSNRYNNRAEKQILFFFYSIQCQ